LKAGLELLVDKTISDDVAAKTLLLIEKIYSANSFPLGIPSDDNFSCHRTNNLDMRGIKPYILNKNKDKDSSLLICEDIPLLGRDDLLKVC
jgi:hypothetical protein